MKFKFLIHHIKDKIVVDLDGFKHSVTHTFLTNVIVSFLCFQSLTVCAQNWNISTGGNTLRNGLSNQFGPIDSSLVWTGGLPSAISRSAVSDSIYLAMVRINNFTDFINGSKIVMMDIRNGDTIWTKNLPVDFPNTDWYNRISAIKNGVLYATRSGNNNTSFLYAINASNGSLIWKSESLIDESSSEGLNFLANGDLIVGNTQSILRINKMDGTTVWQTTRLSYGDGSELAIYGSKIYGIINDLGILKLASFDSFTGQLLYKSTAIDGGLVQQLGPFIGNNGKIYLPRSQGNPFTDYLYSFTDNGVGLTQNWRLPIDYIPFSSSGIGPDGSVYSYNRSGRIIRIDPTLGVVTDSSMVVLYGNASYPRMSIDAAGKVYVTNGGFSDGFFYSFNADLSLRWQTPIENVFVGGPIIGWEGTLVVCGVGTDIRAYKGEIVAATNENISKVNSKNSLLFPNPFRDQLNFKVDPSLIGSSFFVYDYTGRSVFTGTISSEISTYDLSHLSSGIYMFVIGNNKERLVKLIKE